MKLPLRYEHIRRRARRTGNQARPEVTTTQAYKLYHALKDNNVPVKFIAFPVPGHSPADPIRSRDVWRRWTAWLDTYLSPAGGTIASATGSASESRQTR